MGSRVVRHVSRETLRTNIWVAPSMLKPFQKWALGLNVERIREEVADDLVGRIMGRPESETVILQPDLTGAVHSSLIGRWDVDEPHPCPDLKER